MIIGKTLYLRNKNINTMKDKIFEIVYTKLPYYCGDMDLSKDFSYDLAADSLDMIDIIFEVEKEFDITIHEDEIQKIETVGDLVRLAEKKITEKGCAKAAFGHEK